MDGYHVTVRYNAHATVRRTVARVECRRPFKEIVEDSFASSVDDFSTPLVSRRSGGSEDPSLPFATESPLLGGEKRLVGRPREKKGQLVANSRPSSIHSAVAQILANDELAFLSRD